MVVVCPKVNGLILFPIPMWKQVKHVFVRPFALVHIINIFWETRQINDSKIGATCRVWVGSRLSDIVKARPDIHSTDKIDIFHCLPKMLMRAPPRYVAIVVRGAGITCFTERTIPCRPNIGGIAGHTVISPCHQSGCAFGNDKRHTGKVLRNICIITVVIVKPDNVERTGTEKVVVRVGFVVTCRYGSGRVKFTYHIRQLFSK
ncbi:hypothetical protein EZS27_018003 [termite gut metagenome]|uniref:Uncharacterized protein n=1 Tax=termite gut metagenome TaxID=433724 RepID=A0A5J4RJU5_9ZZZZ